MHTRPSRRIEPGAQSRSWLTLLAILVFLPPVHGAEVELPAFFPHPEWVGPGAEAIVAPPIPVVWKGETVSVEGARSLREAALAIGAAYYHRGDLERSLKVFESALAQVKDPELFANEARVLQRLGRAEEGLEPARRALKEKDDDASLHRLLGLLLLDLARFDEAGAALDQAARRAPTDPRTALARGLVLAHTGALTEAEEAFREAVARGGGARASLNLAAVLARQDRPADAEGVLVQATASRREELEADRELATAAAYALATARARQGEWTTAAEAWRRGRELGPTSPGRLLQGGYLEFRSGDLEAASASYEAAFEGGALASIARLHLASIAARADRPEQVVGWLAEGLDELEPEEVVEGRRLLARAREALGENDLAMAAWRELLEARPEDLDGLAALGSLARRAGRTDEARSLLERAWTADPQRQDVARELAALARAESDLPLERSIYLRVLELTPPPSAWWAHVGLAAIELREGEIEAAAVRLEALPELLPAGAEELRRLTTIAQTTLRARDEPRARDELRQLARAEPADIEAQGAEARIAALEGDLESARKLLATILRPGDDGYAAAALGQVLWAQGASAAAVGPLDAALRSAPRWVSVLVARGEIALGAGETGRAVALLSTAEKSCRRGQAAAGPLSGHTVVLPLGASDARVCARAGRALGAALLATALETLEPDPVSARDLADRTLQLGIEGPSQALALFVRGTAMLALGDPVSARRDLRDALDSDLAATVRPLAHNNLAIALQEVGEPALAVPELEAASTLPAALLNLGLVLEQLSDPAAALLRYEAFLAVSDHRRDEISARVERLRRLLP